MSCAFNGSPLTALGFISAIRSEMEKKRPEQGIFTSGCQCFSKTRNIQYHENHKGHISFVASEALISSVPEQYTHFADDNRFCYNTHHKKKKRSQDDQKIICVVSDSFAGAECVGKLPD